MQIVANKVNEANVTFSNEIEKKELDKKVSALAEKSAKNLTIAGFRKGKAPVAEVLKRYGKELENDVKNELFRDIIEEGLKSVGKESADLIGSPIVTKFEEKNEKINIEIEASFRPSIDVSGYEQLLPAFDYPTATDEEVANERQAILYNVAPLVAVEKPNGVENGDVAVIDFSGTIDGVAFAGGAANDFQVLIGSGALIPGFEDGVVGMKAGETKEINVTFPAEYQATELAGKAAVFTVTLKAIVNKAGLELNDETLKQLLPQEENPTEARLNEIIKQNIVMAKLQNLIATDLRPKFSEALVAQFNFDLPNNIVEQEIDMRLNQAFAGFSDEEKKTLSENRIALLEKREEFRVDAQNSVKLTFLIDKLAQVKEIEVSDNELIQQIYFEAQQNGIDPKAHLENLRSRGVLPIIKMSLVESKLFTSLFAK